MKRIEVRGLGVGKESRILCIVGVAVYHVALWDTKSVQNVGPRRGGMMTAEEQASGARKEAHRPWMWNRGMMSIVRSASVS